MFFTEVCVVDERKIDKRSENKQMGRIIATGNVCHHQFNLPKSLWFNIFLPSCSCIRNQTRVKCVIRIFNDWKCDVNWKARHATLTSSAIWPIPYQFGPNHSTARNYRKAAQAASAISSVFYQFRFKEVLRGLKLPDTEWKSDKNVHYWFEKVFGFNFNSRSRSSTTQSTLPVNHDTLNPYPGHELSLFFGWIPRAPFKTDFVFIENLTSAHGVEEREWEVRIPTWETQRRDSVSQANNNNN